MDPIAATAEPAPADAPQRRNPVRRPFLLLSALLILYTGALLVYSQTMAFVWDEGFHILAAQLIDRGETPYLDFCFPQTPLNAYWNAGWMAVFGESWRVTHTIAALEIAVAIFLVMDFVFARFFIVRWRFAAALAAAIFVGFNVTVVQFGPVSQAYAIGLLLVVAAFRASVAAVASEKWLIAGAAGLLAGCAAGTTLLTAPVAPVLLIWIVVSNRAGGRWAKGGAFVVGALVPFAPMFWLFAKAPRRVFFNIVQYQAIFRRVNWNGATPHDVDVLSGWLNDVQSLLLGLLAPAGLWYVARRSRWDVALRREFYLCGWLSLVLVLYISTAHPTFSRYFIFAIPFLTILAMVGLYWAGSRLGSPERPLFPTALVIALVVLALARALFDDRDSEKWTEYQDIARKVDQVTAPNGRLYADEMVYFLTRRMPPRGMEFSYAHELELPAAEEKLYHIISKRELTEQVKAGKFDTVQSCNDDMIDKMGLTNLFPHEADIGDCSIFWGKVKGK